MTLVGRVVARSLVVLVAALIAVGLGTAAVLHGIEVRAVDRALLVAATSGRRGAWEVEDVAAPVEVRWADPRRVPRAWIDQVVRSGQPLWLATRDRRLLLVPAEAEDDDDHEDEDHRGRRRVVIASAPRVTWSGTVGRFGLAYAAAAGLVTAGAGLVQRRWLGHAVQPLSAAVEEVTRAAGAAMGTRIDVGGPAEIAALLGAVDALLARRDDAFRARSRFTAVAAHELRTPVAAMLGELDVALRRPRTAGEYQAALGAVRDQVRQLADLVEGLLLLARVDAGQAEQNRVREHAVGVAEAAARRERPQIESRGGTLRIEAGADPEVEVHEALVVAALANLLRNAAVHAPGSAVVLRIDGVPEGVRFVVEDDGPGIDATSRAAEPRGLGLGLPLARQIAQRHGGDCRVLERDAGAAVALVLPTASP